jgi:CRP/FNR family transcriptional regulator, cyclic AMP receptor protein
MGSSQRFWYLLNADERRALWALGHDREYPPGAVICVEGDPATHLFILIGGLVKVLAATDNGHETILALRGDGEIVGETSGETVGRRNATMRAIDSVHALIVSYERFSTFLDTSPGASRAYRRMMAERWSNTDTMLRQRTGTSGAQRLAGLLLYLAGRHGSETGTVIEIALPVSQDELASLAGTSRATVARALSDWRKRGLIRTGQRRMTLIDLPGIRKAAGPASTPPADGGLADR